MIFVIDPSVVMKWYLPEEGSDKADELKTWLLKEAHSLAAPELFLSESANILWKKVALHKEITLQTSLEMYHEILKIGIHLHADQPFLPQAIETALHSHSSVYDALYLVLAEQLGSHFITADARLKRRLASTRWGKQIQLL